MMAREELADEMEAGLVRHVLAPFYPRCLDGAGGFHERYDRAWNETPDEGRSLVAQARHTWTCATMAEAGFAGDWRGWTAHGVAYLRDRLHAGGGRFHWRLGAEGEPVGDHAGGSVLYGHAFALFALAAAARAVPQTEALGLAREAFGWYERAHRDQGRPGSFEYADREGRPAFPIENEVGVAGDQRSQNSPLHLLEALTELYRVWPDATVARRVRETVALLTETMFLAPGHLAFAIGPDGGLSPEPRTYGHDVEAGHLVLAAERTLGEATPLARERAWALVAAPMAAGFVRDAEGRGSLADGPLGGNRTWWVQAESLLALATLVAEGEDRMGELRAQWAWMRDRQADAEFGGFLPAVDAEGGVVGDGAKAGPWKTGYHDGRALLFSARLLRGGRVGEDPDERVPRGY